VAHVGYRRTRIREWRGAHPVHVRPTNARLPGARQVQRKASMQCEVPREQVGRLRMLMRREESRCVMGMSRPRTLDIGPAIASLDATIERIERDMFRRRLDGSLELETIMARNERATLERIGR
jgi:hypothetical protein